MAKRLVPRHRCVSDRQRGRLLQARDAITVLGYGLFPSQLVFDWKRRASTAQGGRRGQKHAVLERNTGKKSEDTSNDGPAVWLVMLAILVKVITG